MKDAPTATLSHAPTQRLLFPSHACADRGRFLRPCGWLLNTGRSGAPSAYGGGGRPPRSKLAQNVVE